jgi:hypothetical protein
MAILFTEDSDHSGQWFLTKPSFSRATAGAAKLRNSERSPIVTNSDDNLNRVLSLCHSLNSEQSMTITITLSSDCLHSLDLSPVATVIENLLLEKSAITSYEQQLRFELDYPRTAEDPRELSEIPEVRLWFIRLDARYPWLPFLLDWKAGELVRYTAMLVPHQFNRKEGIQYNPEALEIFLMQKIFVLTDWLRQLGIPSQSRLKSMGQMLGYDLDESLFEVL